MEFKTNKEMAEYIVKMGFSEKKLSTLERRPKEELELIIQNERDIENEELQEQDDKVTAVKSLLEFLDTCKKEREGKGISEGLKGYINKNAKSIKIPTFKGIGLVSSFLLLAVIIYVAIDSILGMSKVKELVKKVAKRSKNETKQNNPYNS